jgi:hypothetical protein
MHNKKGRPPDKIVLNASTNYEEKDASYQRFSKKVTKESFAKEVMSKLPMTINIKRHA